MRFGPLLKQGCAAWNTNAVGDVQAAQPCLGFIWAQTSKGLPRRGLIALALAVSGCISPEPAFYTLAVAPGAPQPGAPRLVELRRPSIAGYLDRSEIVRGDADPYRLDVRAGERWGEPFGTMLGRVLAEDLNQRLPGSTVFTAQGSLSPDPQARIEIDVPRFDLGTNGRIILRAQVVVSRLHGGGAARTRTVQVEATPASTATTALVAAMSQALGRVADAIAAMLRGA